MPCANRLLLNNWLPLIHYLICVSCPRLADYVTHLRINNDGDCFDILGPTGGETFASLSDLVGYYMDSSGGSVPLKEKNGNVIEMKYPLPTCDHSTERSDLYNYSFVWFLRVLSLEN